MDSPVQGPITTTSLSPPMLFFGRKRSNRHKSLFKANLTRFLGMGSSAGTTNQPFGHVWESHVSLTSIAGVILAPRS